MSVATDRTVTVRRRPDAALLVVGLLLVLLAGPRPASAGEADRLTLRPADLPAMTPVAPGLPAARAAAAVLVPRGGRPPTTRPVVEAAAYRQGRGAPTIRLGIQAFGLASPAQARAALARWRALARGAHRPAATARVGDAAAISGRRSRGRSDVEVALRVRSGLAIVRLRSRRPLAEARTLALAYARREALRLEAALTRTAWDRARDGVRADGTMPTATLLQLVSLRYRPIAGVRLPAGDRTAPDADGTWLLEQLARVFPTLSKARQRAVSRSLATPAAPPRKGSPARMTRGQKGTCSDPSGEMPVDAVLTAGATRFRAAIASRVPNLGFVPSWTVCVYRSPRVDGIADTRPWRTTASEEPYTGFFDFAVDDPDECYVRVFPDFDRRPPHNQLTILAHEMYHCLHFEWSNGAGGSPAWVEEGLATWTGHQVAPGTFEPSDFAPGVYYDTWLKSPGLSLFKRDYSAFAFFGLVEQESGSGRLWSQLVDIWKAGSDSAAIFDLATTSNQADVLNDWGPGYFRQPGFPHGWMQSLPFAVPDPRWPFDAAPFVELTEPFEETVDGYRSAQFAIESPDRPLVEATLEGSGRLSDGVLDLVHPRAVWLCLGGRCACPTGQHEAKPIPSHTDLRRTLYAGIAAAGEETRLILTPHRLSEYCEPDAAPAPAPRHGRNGGGSAGDPHLQTFDAANYDLQAVGEFVLARSTAGGFEVQSRQEQWKSRPVAINTQFALRVGAARVTVAVGRPLDVRVDGKVVHPERAPVALAGGGRLLVGTGADPCQALRVVWSDASEACVLTYGPDALDIAIHPAEGRRGTFVGLLGDADGDWTNDFRRRDGTLLDARLLTEERPGSFDLRYHRFADDWRVSQAESLLHYGPGQTTATFTRRGFPARFASTADLAPAVRERATATCRARGVVDAERLEGCILDVGQTGLDAFADGAAAAEEAAIRETPWTVLPGLEHVVAEPVGVLATPDGVLHVAAATQPANDWTQPGSYALATVGVDGRPGPVEQAAPQTYVGAPVLAYGQGAPGLLAYVDRWPVTTPPGVATPGILRWPLGPPVGPVAEWLPGAGESVTASVQTADGTPYTVVVGRGGGSATVVRGTGATAIASPLPTGPGCYGTNVSLATDGTSVWAAWLEWACSDTTRYGIVVAAVDTGTGAVGPPVELPTPAGTREPLYDALGAPIALATRPGAAGAVVAYTLDVGDVRHAFLYATADGSVVDLGPIAATRPMPLVAATTGGRLFVAWADRSRNGRALLRVRRLAPGATALDPARWTLTWPQTAGGTVATIARVGLATRGERLDVVATAVATPTTDGGVWHVQLG